MLGLEKWGKKDVPNPNFINASLSAGNRLVIARYGHILREHTHTHTHAYFTQVSFKYELFPIIAGYRLPFQPIPSVHMPTTHIKIHPNRKYFSYIHKTF